MKRAAPKISSRELDAIIREHSGLIRDHFLQMTPDYVELFCECGTCGTRKSLNVNWFHKAVERLGRSLDDELGQRVINFTDIYWHIDDAFARHSVEKGWRVFDGVLYCPACLQAYRL